VQVRIEVTSDTSCQGTADWTCGGGIPRFALLGMEHPGAVVFWCKESRSLHSAGLAFARRLRSRRRAVTAALSLLLEEQRREVNQVVAPDHPGVTPWGFDHGHRNLLLLQPCGEGAVGCDEVIVCTAGDPQ
jgi:hypothetical protein